jgi:hypothetical protein
MKNTTKSQNTLDILAMLTASKTEKSPQYVTETFTIEHDFTRYGRGIDDRAFMLALQTNTQLNDVFNRYETAYVSEITQSISDSGQCHTVYITVTYEKKKDKP